MGDAATVVLVHGGASGAWTWHLVVDELVARGIAAVAVDLPSCSAPDNSVGPRDDAAHLCKVMDETGGPFVLVGNSYGGYLISDVANDRTDVLHLVFLAALMPDPGKPLMEMITEATFPSDDIGLSFLEDGRVVFDVDADLRTSYQLAPQQEQEYVRARSGRPMSLGTEPASLDRVAWESIPSTYVVCTEDRALRPDAQRAWAARATHAVELTADHCAQHSRPGEIADILAHLAASS
jgi:pimeloyl-ACP methyl ester carboxylesterase